ncbi:TonB-dependent receptor [Candidatus Marinimicrobia bacterium]|nr:TonB-dependent receptor [Candidatus Neomarinimicrobiota bacterium]
MLRIFFGVLFFLLLTNCSNKDISKPSLDILAQVGDKIITKQDFIRRSEYTIRPDYCRQSNYIHKKIILNSLIAEKITSIEMEDKEDVLLNSQNFHYYLQGRKEQAMRKLYYYENFYKGAKVPDSIVNEKYKLAGLHYFNHDLKNERYEIRNKFYNSGSDSSYVPEIFGDSSAYADVYNISPKEVAFYVQDKMEFDDMVINIGLRYDQFDPESVYPSDRRNPANQLILPDSMMSLYPQAPVISQISPRVGFAYQLGGQAVLHFSYGHFFQMPPMYAMYENNSFLVDPNNFVTRMGSTLLEPEKTITYEIGLWQELNQVMALDVALFYRDIYNLLTTKTISTYNQVKYGLFSNKDYGNVRGLELKLDLALGQLKGMVNYTLQYTRGNADSPGQTFDRAGNNQDPVNRFIPMGWDQRHTLNGSLIYGTEKYGGSMTAYYNSGSPYTFTPQSESVLSRINLYPNNDYRPEKYSVDCSFYYRKLANFSIARLCCLDMIYIHPCSYF